jgi:hypothetical protein
MARKNQDQNLGAFDRVDNRLGVIGSGKDIARRNPATDADGLKRRSCSIRRRLVQRRIADEDVESHPHPLRCSIRAADGEGCNPTFPK